MHLKRNNKMKISLTREFYNNNNNSSLLITSQTHRKFKEAIHIATSKTTSQPTVKAQDLWKSPNSF